MLIVKKYKRKGAVDIEAVQFTTNNEQCPEGTFCCPNMDTIVNWINRGSETCKAWHNGTDIFVLINFIGWFSVKVGNWVVKEEDNTFHVYPPSSFEKNFTT